LLPRCLMVLFCPSAIIYWLLYREVSNTVERNPYDWLEKRQDWKREETRRDRQVKKRQDWRRQLIGKATRPEETGDRRDGCDTSVERYKTVLHCIWYCIHPSPTLYGTCTITYTIQYEQQCYNHKEGCANHGQEEGEIIKGDTSNNDNNHGRHGSEIDNDDCDSENNQEEETWLKKGGESTITITIATTRQTNMTTTKWRLYADIDRNKDIKTYLLQYEEADL